MLGAQDHTQRKELDISGQLYIRKMQSLSLEFGSAATVFIFLGYKGCGIFDQDLTPPLLQFLYCF